MELLAFVSLIMVKYFEATIHLVDLYGALTGPCQSAGSQPASALRAEHSVALDVRLRSQSYWRGIRSPWPYGELALDLFGPIESIQVRYGSVHWHFYD